MNPPRRVTRVALGALLIALAGCATTAGPARTAANPADPWEAWNRKVFAFNEAVDEAVFKPVAETYRNVVPELVRTGVGNVFGNFGDAWSTVNHFLQGKLASGLEMGMRVLTNSIFGLGGILDPATEMKLTRRSEDFGQTLGVWGLGSGPYVVLPFLGPSSVRDTAGLPFDNWAGSPTRWVDTSVYALTALQLVHVRSELLATTQLASDVSLDKYSFIRDAYLSRRLDQVYDGAPPLPKFDDDVGDAPPPSK